MPSVQILSIFLKFAALKQKSRATGKIGNEHSADECNWQPSNLSSHSLPSSSSLSSYSWTNLESRFSLEKCQNILLLICTHVERITTNNQSAVLVCLSEIGCVFCPISGAVVVAYFFCAFFYSQYSIHCVCNIVCIWVFTRYSYTL